MTKCEVVLGDPNSILQLGPAAMKKPEEWSPMDSDIIAHFLQVQRQITNSTWYLSKTSYTMQCENLLDSSFPTFESFVFAVVYFRQLIEDKLFEIAIDRYLSAVDCQIRSKWIKEEKKHFISILNNKPLLPDIGNIKVCKLLKLFLYGSGLMHKYHGPNSTSRKIFLKIIDTQPRQQILFALNMSLKLLLNHVNNVAIVIYYDYSYWLNEYSLPHPDIRWHDRLFVVEPTNGPPKKDKAP